MTKYLSESGLYNFRFPKQTNKKKIKNEEKKQIASIFLWMKKKWSHFWNRSIDEKPVFDR